MFFFVFNSQPDQGTYPLNLYSSPYYQTPYVYEPMLIQDPQFYHPNHQEIEHHQNQANVEVPRPHQQEIEPTPQSKKFKRDRNIKSNALKLFLKYLRRDLSLREGYHREMIQKISQKPEENLNRFKSQLEKLIPASKNYIRVHEIIKICHMEEPEYSFFTRVFRISIKKFFRETIYLFNSKYTRTKQYVRREQIQAGLVMLDEIFQTRGTSE